MINLTIINNEESLFPLHITFTGKLYKECIRLTEKSKIISWLIPKVVPNLVFTFNLTNNGIELGGDEAENKTY